MTAPQFTKETVAACFNRAASTYHTASQLPDEIARRLLEHLDSLPIEPKVILNLGAATGYSSQLLQQRFPTATVITSDIAIKMLQQSGESLCVTIDYENLPFAPQSIDLVYSNLSLAWAVDVEKVLQEIHSILAPQGLFLFSTFGPATLIELNASWAQVDDLLHSHQFFDMHDIGDALLHKRFSNPVMEMENLTMVHSGVKSLLKDLKASGFHNIANSRFKGLTGKTRFNKFLAAYEKYKDRENLLPATYEIIYGHARRANEVFNRVNEQNEILIPLSDIKKGGNKSSPNSNQR